MAKNTQSWDRRPRPKQNCALVCNFKNILVTEVTRNKDKGKDYVSDELFSLLYQTTVVAFGRIIDVSFHFYEIVPIRCT